MLELAVHGAGCQEGRSQGGQNLQVGGWAETVSALFAPDIMTWACRSWALRHKVKHMYLARKSEEQVRLWLHSILVNQ